MFGNTQNVVRFRSISFDSVRLDIGCILQAGELADVGTQNSVKCTALLNGGCFWKPANRRSAYYFLATCMHS